MTIGADAGETGKEELSTGWGAYGAEQSANAAALMAARRDVLDCLGKHPRTAAMQFDLTEMAQRDGLNARLTVSLAVLNYLSADGDKTSHWQTTLRDVARSIEAADEEGNGTALVTLAADCDSDSIRVFIVVGRQEGGSVATVGTPREMFR